MISVPVCKTLSDDERDKLAEVMEEVSFDRNERIIAQGDSADAMWVSFATSSSIAGIRIANRASGRSASASVPALGACLRA